jgi:hypothetical protein
MHKARFGAEMLMSFVKGKTGFASGDSGTAAGQSDLDSFEGPSADDTAPATAEEAGKQSSIDQAAVAEAGIDGWADAQVTVEPASVEATNSQNTLSPDDLLPAWSGPRPAGT